MPASKQATLTTALVVCKLRVHFVRFPENIKCQKYTRSFVIDAAQSAGGLDLSQDTITTTLNMTYAVHCALRSISPPTYRRAQLESGLVQQANNKVPKR